MYTFVDAAVVRAASCTSGLDVVPWPDLTDSTSEHVAQWRCWLEQVWAQDAIAAAVEVASPVLARSVREVCAGRHHEARRVRGMVVSVARYLLRMTGRATPFGLFAGVAPARFGSGPVVRYGDGHHAVTRVDMEWLASVITRLETCLELRRRLPVVLNNLAFVRDGRLVVGCQQQPAGSGRTDPAQVSVRHTRAVETIMQAARTPIRVGELVDKLMAEFSATPTPVMEGMLAELVAQRILITSLRPPMTATDPLAHVIKELAAVGADAEPQVADLFHKLRDIHLDLSGHNRASSPTEGRERRSTASVRMSAISTSERPITVDLRVDCALVLPQAVAREAETAATALARLTPHPGGVPAWQDYHSRVLERYGIGAVIPVSEIVNDGVGLGFPAGYRDSRLELPRSSLSERDTRLLVLAQNAAMNQSTEVVLDDSAIVDLMAGDFAQVRVQPHTELRFCLHSPTWEAVKRGEFTLGVVGVSRAAGTMTGRFLDLLDSGDRDRMFGVYARLPTVNGDALPVQVSCPPLYPRTANIARSPAVVPHLVSLAEHRGPDEAVIPLEDLAVSGDAQRLYLMSLSRGCPVEPTVFSALEFTNAAHPLVRFLCEISTARAAACGPFSWGAASRLPFLPRIHYKRTILSPARWILAASDLPGRDAPWPEWVESLTDWRHRTGVSDAVYLGDDDRRIRLNLDEPAHLHILRSDLNRSAHATVREAPDTDAFGWLDGRAHEMVVPLAATSRSLWPPIPRRVTPVHVIGPDHGHLPGNSEWLSVKLYGQPDRHTAILSTHIPSLLSTWDKPPQWWFLPYRDPENHLRLRFRLPDVGMFGRVTRCIGAWAAGLRRLGLIGTVQLDTYYPETGRFGSGAAMAAAECVFAVDSSAALAQRTLTASGSPHPHAVTAASFVDLAVSFFGEVDGGMRWLIDHLSKTPGPATAREVHDQAIRLANPHDEWFALRATPGGQVLIQAWSARRKALAAYRDRLTEAGEPELGCVLACLLHLHHIRMNGIDPERERVSRRLARAAALRWVAQDRREKP